MKKLLGLSLGFILTASFSFAGGMTSVTNPGGATTQIQFNDGGVFGGDSSFVWDKTNNRLGIGVTPTTPIDIQDSLSGGLNTRVKNTDTGASASVSTTLLNSANSYTQYQITSPNFTPAGVYLPSQGIWTIEGNGGLLLRSLGTGPIQFATTASATLRMILSNDGKLGIGVSSPTAYLHLLPGIAAANGAPLKFDEGVCTTTAVAGETCYEGNYFLTKKNAVRFGLGGTLKVSPTEAGNNAGGADTDVFSHTILGGTLHGQGGEIEYRVAGTFAATASTDKRIKVVWGTTTIFDSGALAITTANSWTLYCRIMRNGSAITQKTSCNFNSSSAILPSTVSYLATGENLSSNLTLKLALSGTNANDVVGEFYKTMFYTYEKP